MVQSNQSNRLVRATVVKEHQPRPLTPTQKLSVAMCDFSGMKKDVKALQRLQHRAWVPSHQRQQISDLLPEAKREAEKALDAAHQAIEGMRDELK